MAWYAACLTFGMPLANIGGMAKKKKAKAATPVMPPAPPPMRFGSIHPGKPDNPLLESAAALPPQFVEAVGALEDAIGLPLWLLVQDSAIDRGQADSFNMLGDRVTNAFFQARHADLAKGKKIALLIDSNGGMARQAYEVAMLLRRHCGGFVAVIPRHAKSAATLLALGADAIIMNDHAEMGPLDVQIYDPDREEWLSGLDEVQSLERLQAFALDAMDRTTMFLLQRSPQKVKNLLPLVTEFVTKLTEPMFRGVDVVRYTQMSRLLKVAQEYGQRLLYSNYDKLVANEIARKLVETYPEHGFPIYPDEVLELGLRLSESNATIKSALEKVTSHLPNLNVVGRII